MEFKEILRTNTYTKDLYKAVKRIYYRRKNSTNKYKFINRSKGCEKLCIVLAGYKNFLIPAVMGRIKKYAPGNVDVCIITSGKWSEEIAELCERNGWSYLSTKRNNVSLAQNVAIDIFKDARYIFKLDEDIFITEDYFERMLKAYEECEKSTDYKPGVMAPLLPINGYGHVQILRKFGMDEVYKSVFGDLKVAAGPDRKIENSPELARFMWGEGIKNKEFKEYKLPGIDEMNRLLYRQETKAEPCAIRFSIGAILFEREFWESMNYFQVGKGPGMGDDEVQLCEHCMLVSRPLMVTHNIVVGHLAFGGQNQAMKEYYEGHKVLFMPPEE